MRTLYHNCQIFSPEKTENDNYFIIDDGKVESRGISESWDGEVFDEKVNLNGKVVTPGIGDAHVHVASLGWAKEILDLHSSRSKETFLSLLKSFIESEKWKNLKPDVNCLEGSGWWEESELPSLEEIDAITGDFPAIFHRRCLHIVFMNSAAIRELKLNDGSVEFQDNMKIVRRSDGTASGLLREGYAFIKSSKLKFESLALQKRFILSGLDICVKAGLTQVHACEEENWKAWVELSKANLIKIRVYLSIFYFSLENFDGTDNFPKYPNENHGLVTADRIKLFADGALGASTAALSLNYKGKDHNGMALESVETLVSKINKLHQKNWRIEIHVIGDRSVDNFLDALEKCDATVDEIRKFRHILNHSQMIRADQIPKIKKYGLSCSIQPQFVESDAPWCLSAVPDELHSALYTWKTFLNEGIMIHGGSDGPVEEILPIEAMRAAMQRRDGSGGTFMPEQCLNLNETLSLFTLGVAQGVRAENRVGSLTTGQFADFNIWKEGTNLNADSVENFKVDSSFVNGKLVFSQN